MRKRSILRLAAMPLAAVALLAGCTEGIPSLTAPAGPRLTVTPTNAFATFDAGGTHSCGVTSGGQAWCWGRNSVGQLGDSSAASTTVPVAVFQPGLSFTDITAGALHTCALVSSGQAYCWGNNGDGRLGDSTTTLPLAPVAVKPLGGVAFTSLSAGGAHTCGLDSSGQAYCWGNNQFAQIGDSTKTFAVTPVAVHHPTGVTFTEIHAGDKHTCALDGSTGQAYCWGYGGDGAIGNNALIGPRIPTAVQQPVGVTFASIVTEYNHTCGVTSAGQAYCWGLNFDGQLGDGTTVTPRKVPVAVVQPVGVTYTQLTTGGTYTCGLDGTGQTYCWGKNQYGQFGNGTTTPSLSAVAMTQPAGVAFTEIHAGSTQTFGLDGVGQTWGSGRNDFAQLGDGSTTQRTSPVAVAH
jgi:alpha-tubulin suppressor-like RCC1 family protein